VTNILSPADPSISLAASEYGWPEQLPNMEKRLLHHACRVDSDMTTIVQSGHVTGLAQLSKYVNRSKAVSSVFSSTATDTSRYLVMARSCYHVRHAVCAVSAAHLCTLTHSTEISRVELENRVLAMRAMGQDLRIKHPSRVVSFDNYLEEMIASSTLLGWNAPCGYAMLSPIYFMKQLLSMSCQN
jgi:hypothetical protein